MYHFPINLHISLPRYGPNIHEAEFLTSYSALVSFAAAVKCCLCLDSKVLKESIGKVGRKLVPKGSFALTLIGYVMFYKSLLVS